MRKDSRSDRKFPAAQIAAQGSLIQRSPSVHGNEQATVPPFVRSVLASTGQPLEPATRAFMEPRFGHDFSQVRVHTDTRAAESAGAVNALAYTVGRDIVFGAGQYAPGTRDGRTLVAHELTHTIQQGRAQAREVSGVSLPGDRAEQEADAAAGALIHGQDFHSTLATGVRIARQIPATPALPKSLSRTAFEKIMQQRYQVQLIHTGTFQEQSFGDIQEKDWHAWDPGDASPIYTWIVEAFEKFEAAFGGVPPVKEIFFFEQSYKQASPGHMVADPGTMASYALGRLTIHKSITTSNILREGTDIFTAPTDEQAVHRNITHELGHGIGEIALDQPPKGPAGQDPQLFVDYRKTVGWTAGNAPELFDIQAAGVADALNKGTPPPADAHIRRGNWQSAKWKERPVTRYMTDNPGEDFAEAVMAYVNEPDTLKSLSPTRYKFLDARKSAWAPSAKKLLDPQEAEKQGGQPRTLEPGKQVTLAAFDLEDADLRARRLAAMDATRNAIKHISDGLSRGHLWSIETLTPDRGSVNLDPVLDQSKPESLTNRQTRLKKLLTDLTGLIVALESAPIPQGWLAPDAVFKKGSTIGVAGGTQASQDAQMFYVHRGNTMKMDMDLLFLNIQYIETGPVANKKIKPVALGSKVQTGVYIVVPDEKNAPLDYRRLRSNERVGRAESIIEVWHDDFGYYYPDKIDNEKKHYLPGFKVIE
jgi:hypothetical protein